MEGIISKPLNDEARKLHSQLVSIRTTSLEEVRRDQMGLDQGDTQGLVLTLVTPPLGRATITV